jgi:hypothetical protein
MKGDTIMNKISAKFYQFLPVSLFVLSLLVTMGSCMMPELAPELYVGALNIENAGEVNIDKAGAANIYGEEYLKITQHPALLYYTTDPNPGSDWYTAGLRVNLIKGDGTDGGDVTASCTFTPVDMTPGPKEITVSRENKTAVFPIAVLDTTASLNELVVLNPPYKTEYRPYESVSWAGLEVTEISYGGDPTIPPETNLYTYPDPAITVSSPNLTTFGTQVITVTKVDNTAKTATFRMAFYDLTWYVEATGDGVGYTPYAPLPSITDALAKIKKAYAEHHTTWPANAQATIVVSGEINSDGVEISEIYPPLLFKGSPEGGVVPAELYIHGNTVTLGENLTWIGNINCGNFDLYDGSLVMERGCTVGSPDTYGYYGTGVYVWISQGSFTLNGGRIYGNLGLGRNVSFAINADLIVDHLQLEATYNMKNSDSIKSVEFSGNGTFTMDSGASLDSLEIYSGATFTMIDGNSIKSVNVDYEGTFIMNGGTISKESSSPDYHTGTGVNVVGTFTMNGGTIEGHSVGVIVGSDTGWPTNSTFNLNGGTIRNNDSSGIEYQMTGHDNFQYYYHIYGGGVIIQNGTFNMAGGAIRNNTSKTDGGGVLIKANTYAIRYWSWELKYPLQGAVNKTGGVIENNHAGTGYHGDSFYAEEYEDITTHIRDDNRLRFDMAFDANKRLILNHYNPQPLSGNSQTWNLIDVPTRQYDIGGTRIY